MKTFKEVCNRRNEFIWDLVDSLENQLVLLTCGYSEEAAFKSRCVEWNIALLENYLPPGSQQGEDCILRPNDETKLSVKNCDCSDPQNYDYVDEGRFKNYMRLYIPNRYS